MKLTYTKIYVGGGGLPTEGYDLPCWIPETDDEVEEAFRLHKEDMGKRLERMMKTALATIPHSGR